MTVVLINPGVTTGSTVVDAALPGWHWAPRHFLPVAVEVAAAATVGGKIYFAGGDNGGPPLVGAYVYDPANDAAGWVPIADLPNPVSDGAATAVGGKIYLAGGWNAGTHLAAMHVYDPANDAAGWVPTIDLPAVNSDFGFVTVGTKIFVIGGSGLATLADVYSLDTSVATPSWVALASLPEPRSFLTAVAVGGKIYVAGGDGPTSSRFATAYVYDPANDAAGWIALPDLPIALDDAPGVAVGRVVHILGGFSPAAGTQLATNYVYDPAAPGLGWQTSVPMVGGIEYSTAVTVAGAIYVMGGYSNDSPSIRDRVYYLPSPYPPGTMIPQVATGGTAVTARLGYLTTSLGAVIGSSQVDASILLSRAFTPAVAAGSTAVTVSVAAQLPTTPPPGVFTFDQGISLPNLVQPAAPWTVVTGFDAATGLTQALRPPVIGNNQNTHLGWSTSTSAGTGHIFAKVSSEQSYDFFTVIANGVTVVSQSGLFTGSYDFQFPTADGVTTFDFGYAKDISVAAGSDTVFIYKIVLPVVLPVSLLAAGSTAVAVSLSYMSTSLDPVTGSTAAAVTVKVQQPMLPAVAAGFTAVAVSMAAIVQPLIPAVAAGSTAVTVAEIIQHPAIWVLSLVAGRTAVGIVPVRYVELTPEPIYTETDVDVAMALACVFELDVAAGWTQVHIADNTFLLPAVVAGSTAVTAAIRSAGQRRYLLDKVVGSTVVRIAELPNLGNNTPILLAFSATARLESTDLLVSE